MKNYHKKYFEYLQTRSRLGIWYRNHWLYPRICKLLSGRVLDIGCGIGDFLEFRPNTIGTDINVYAVSFCKGRGLEAVQMSQDVLPFASGEFDGVILDNVLEHIISPESLLNEVRRVLKPSGIFVVGVPGKKGFVKDSDHKVYYDQTHLDKTVCAHGFNSKVSIYTPFKFSLFNKHLAQYCLFTKFVRDR